MPPVQAFLFFATFIVLLFEPNGWIGSAIGFPVMAIIGGCTRAFDLVMAGWHGP